MATPVTKITRQNERGRGLSPPLPPISPTTALSLMDLPPPTRVKSHSTPSRSFGSLEGLKSLETSSRRPNGLMERDEKPDVLEDDLVSVDPPKKMPRQQSRSEGAHPDTRNIRPSHLPTRQQSQSVGVHTSDIRLSHSPTLVHDRHECQTYGHPEVRLATSKLMRNNMVNELPVYNPECDGDETSRSSQTETTMKMTECKLPRVPQTRGDASALELSLGDANLTLPNARLRARLSKGRIRVAIEIRSSDDRDYALRILASNAAWECDGPAAVVVRFDGLHVFHLSAPTSILQSSQSTKTFGDFHFFMIEGIALPSRRVSLPDPMHHFEPPLKVKHDLPPIHAAVAHPATFDGKNKVAFRKLLSCSPPQDLLGKGTTPLTMEFQPKSEIKFEPLYNDVIGAIVTVTNNNPYNVTVQPKTTHPDMVTVSPPYAVLATGASVPFVIELTGPAPKKAANPQFVFTTYKTSVKGTCDSSPSFKRRLHRQSLVARSGWVREMYVTSQEKPSIFGLQPAAFCPVPASLRLGALIEPEIISPTQDSCPWVCRRIPANPKRLPIKSLPNGPQTSPSFHSLMGENVLTALGEGGTMLPANRRLKVTSLDSAGSSLYSAGMRKAPVKGKMQSASTMSMTSEANSSDDESTLDVAVELLGLSNITFRRKIKKAT